MDFSNITSMYSDVYANAANQSASKLQGKLDGADYSKATDEELMDACNITNNLKHISWSRCISPC